jgi:cobalamin biosynthesis Mg chelatase CobN
MPRGILLIAGLAVFSAVLTQGQTANPSTTTPVNGPFGGPILVTPSTSFPNPVPTAGISDAGRAGISNATNAGETTTNPGTTATTPSEFLSEPTNQAPTTDLGTSTFVRGPSDESAASVRAASDESAASMISLADVSNRYKAEKGARSARVLSNEDVQTMLNNKSGVTTAKYMPPLGSGTLEQGGQTQNTGVQSGAAPSTSQSVQQKTQASAQTAPPERNNSSNQNTNSSGQAPTSAPNANAENSTTPQINQNQQSNDTQGSSRLPATATLLPLLGLLGLVSGGIGFWFRKFRN